MCVYKSKLIKTIRVLFETNLKSRLEVFGVLESQIENSPEPLVKVSGLLHEMLVVMHEILDTRLILTINDVQCSTSPYLN